jgi:outer membrane protein OmpA-like peptidoglycan-associated protein
MTGGATASFAGSGFLPGSNVDIYLFPTGTRIGTALVRANGTYSVSVHVPTSQASGNHTALVQGFTTATSRTSFSVGVLVKAAVTKSVAVSQFASGSAKLSIPMQSTIAKLAASIQRHVASSFKITGFNGNATSSVASLIMSRSRAIAVMTFLRSQLRTLHFVKIVKMRFVIIRGRIQGVSVTIG